jgi:hypothetical protein
MQIQAVGQKNVYDRALQNADRVEYKTAALDPLAKAIVTFRWPEIGTIGDVAVHTGPGVSFINQRDQQVATLDKKIRCA